MLSVLTRMKKNTRIDKERSNRAVKPNLMLWYETEFGTWFSKRFTSTQLDFKLNKEGKQVFLT